MKSTNMLLTAILVVLVGGGGFWGGIKYQQSKRLRPDDIRGQFASRQGGAGNRQGGAGMMRGGAVVGDITNLDNNTMTIKMPDGSSKIVVLSESTVYNKTATTDKSEVAVGSKVAIFGIANNDGTVTAQSIQLNPEFRGLWRGGSPTPTTIK